MSDQMYVLTVTQEEWTYLDRLVKNAAGVPDSLRFALDSATVAQQYMTEEREWRESTQLPDVVEYCEALNGTGYLRITHEA